MLWLLQSENPQEKSINRPLSDLEGNGCNSTLLTIEIGSLGHFLNDCFAIGILQGYTIAPTAIIKCTHWTHDSQRSLMKAAPSMLKQLARKIVDKASDQSLSDNF